MSMEPKTLRERIQRAKDGVDEMIRLWGKGRVPSLSQMREWSATLNAALSDAAPEGAAPLSTDYIQTVPDKCDRIIWRGHYHHLPLATPTEGAAPEGGAEKIAHRLYCEIGMCRGDSMCFFGADKATQDLWTHSVAKVLGLPCTQGQPAAPASGDGDYQHGIRFIQQHANALYAQTAGATERYVVERTIAALASPTGVDGESALWTLRQILADLPEQRDWMDPGVEKVARELVARNRFADLAAQDGGAGHG